MESTHKQRPHDIEIQSPSTPGFVDEKALLSSPSGAIDSPEALSYADVQRPPPLGRRYSKAWWKSAWSAAISEGLWPRFLYSFIGLLYSAIYFAREDLDFNSQNVQNFRTSVQSGYNRNYGMGNPANSSGNSADGGSSQEPTHVLSLSGSLKQFDQNARKLVVEWMGMYQENLTTDPKPLGGGPYPNTPYPLKIYRDISTVLYDYRLDQNSTANDTHSNYWDYRLDNSSMPHIGVIGAHGFDSISTDISFSQATNDANATEQPLFSYPFDEWKGEITLVARYAEAGYVATPQGNYSDTWVVPLDGARLEDNSLNWRFDLSFDNTCALSATDMKKYLAENYAAPEDAELMDWGSMTDVQLHYYPVPCQVDITIVATRPPLVKFGAILAVVVNWTSTVFIFILTCECLIMRRGYTMVGSDLLAVTFTALFALPSVRLLLPGAPEFGCLNLVGIIPQVIIVSLCITAIAVAKLHKDGRDRKKEQ